jgi:hypothetical protein
MAVTVGERFLDTTLLNTSIRVSACFAQSLWHREMGSLYSFFWGMAIMETV